MDELKQIQMSSLLILLLQFTGAAIGQRVLYLSVRVGDEATLPCNSVRHDQDECESTTWLFSNSVQTAAVALVKGRQIGEQAGAKSDRLGVTEKCSLVVKKVTEEDAGQYFSRQFRSGQQQGPDFQVYLSVVTMTEHQDNDEVTLRCSVKTYGDCRLSVKWLFQGQDVDTDHKEIRTSESRCYASVTFLTSHFSYTKRSRFFTCAVKYDGNVQTFSPQSSDGDEQQATTTTTTTTTSGRINNSEWWLYTVLALVLLALLITIVAFITWRKMKGKEARESDSVGQTSSPAVNSPQTNPATADPEEGVCYASITYTKNTHKKVEIEADADEGDEVTYSTVKTSTNEPSGLNDTI